MEETKVKNIQEMLESVKKLPLGDILSNTIQNIITKKDDQPGYYEISFYHLCEKTSSLALAVIHSRCLEEASLCVDTVKNELWMIGNFGEEGEHETIMEERQINKNELAIINDFIANNPKKPYEL
jgi:hypothetical protein